MPASGALHLSRRLADRLAGEARRAGIDWSLLLAALGTRGSRRPDPVAGGELRRLADRLRAAGAGRAPLRALARVAGEAAAERTIALARFGRAIGLEALVRGVGAASARLARRVLADPRITIYPEGRQDVAAGLVDARVLALVLYLAESHGQVSVSSLHSGHRLYARPGVISAHVYGLAVDIAALGGRLLLGGQEPGGVAERAVRAILLLPPEAAPRQVISLLDLGGPSFALADHADHIHVGF